MIGLTNLWIKSELVTPPELNAKRATFVLGKIDEILSWDKDHLRERDLRFVDLGRYLCEVRAGQYWRLDKVKSFDDFLEKRFPESRRKAYYLMAIHENLPRIPKHQLREIGWTKATELAKVARREAERFESATWVHRAQTLPKEQFRREVLQRDGWRCQSCGRSENLHAHHLESRGQLGSDTIENLITLCAECHARIHGK